jgi:hypothetical protein
VKSEKNAAALEFRDIFTNFAAEITKTTVQA